MTDPRDLGRLLKSAREERPGEKLFVRLESIRVVRRPRQLRVWFVAAPAALAVAALAMMQVEPTEFRVSPESLRGSEPRSGGAESGLQPKDDQEPRLVPSTPEEKLAQKKKTSPRVGRAPLTLTQELELLAGVRETLRRGEAGRAIEQLDQYGAKLPRGQLRLEAELLRMEALKRQGRSEEASLAAARFVEAHPNSPLVDRARMFVEEGSRTEIARDQVDEDSK